MNFNGPRQTLRIRRKHIWTDTKSALSEEGCIVNHGICVKFDGEEAVDSGGPLREYFELLWKMLQFNAFLFAGHENCRILTHNTYALNHNEFYFFGECIALSVMYGGSLPHFLSQAVLSYVLDETTMGEEIIY